MRASEPGRLDLPLSLESSDLCDVIDRGVRSGMSMKAISKSKVDDNIYIALSLMLGHIVLSLMMGH